MTMKNSLLKPIAALVAVAAKKNLLIGIMFLGVATVVAAPASAGYLLIDDFNDQDTESSLLMSDGVTYGPWSVRSGILEFAEVGGEGSGNYAIRPGDYLDELRFNHTSGGFLTYQPHRRISEDAWPADVTHFQFRVYNLGASAIAGRDLRISLHWQDSNDPAASGRRSASSTASLPALAAGESFLVQLPISNFGALGTEGNVMFGGLEIGDNVGRSFYYDDFAFVPEPATMGLLGLGLAGILARRRRK